ncbi:transmembrane protein, partial [Clarias magur]
VALIVLMNIVSAGLSIAAIVLYSLDLKEQGYYWCREPERHQERYYWTTPSPSKRAEWDEIFEKQLEEYRLCKQNRLIVK